MITKKEDLHGTYVLNDNNGAIELYLSLINQFGISNNIKEVEQSALALEVCRQGDRWVALWIVHSLSALDSESRKLTMSDLKPRTRTEYEKVTEPIFDLRDEFEHGELYCKFEHAREYTQITNTQTLAQALHGGFCFRKVEKEIDWRDEVHAKLQSDYHWSTPITEVINDESDCFLELCRVALRANGEIE